ncbi:MAG: DUF3427 domain-containing protein, partial [Chitinophagales bacterium]|nr:DUF3427 domain-containing protein [Chitinophagales bacterium]
LIEFEKEFKRSTLVTNKFLSVYKILYNSTQKYQIDFDNVKFQLERQVITPNKMQREALQNLENLRKSGKSKALLISATGTGKTYLSAFDVKRFKPKRFLFVVHRRTIALNSLKTFQSILDPSITMGVFSGNAQEIDKDYLFSTIQTISKDEYLEKFDRDHFDYIVIDETHRAGASTYKKIIEYFNPKFLLGMTATPERTDDFDVFEIFGHSIAYEIRLHKAMEEEMLAPFHYYGVTDLTVNGNVVDDKTDFNHLTDDERISRIIEQAEFYGCDDGNIRGLIFCSRQKECEALAEGFSKRGFRTVALIGSSKEEERRDAIDRLESDDKSKKLDYIFTVDIFNEGVDIPKVNQIIMLRPTQSAIIFVQQLGRGLRKTNDKQYLTVIDFIGNYSNNYLVPIALYGDTSYNKDRLRHLISSGSRLIPGVSTINFDRISKEKIFKSIDSTNLQTKRHLKKDYDLLKRKLGRIPMMMDFVEHGSRDPKGFVEYSKSYFNFLSQVEDEYGPLLTDKQKKLLELFSGEINNAKRIDETILLRELIAKEKITVSRFKQVMQDEYDYVPSAETINSVIDNLNFRFVMETKKGRRTPSGDIYNLKTLKKQEGKIVFEKQFLKHLKNRTFKKFLIDNIKYAINTYDTIHLSEKFFDGFILYQKYSRKDVFRILNWNQNPVGLNVGGYIISPDKSNCPVFVNYHKSEDISSTTKYDDRFLNPRDFTWMSKSNRTLESGDVKIIRKGNIRLPLFVKKSNDEGKDFYYMGEMKPIEDSFTQETLQTDDGKQVPVVRVLFEMQTSVEDEIYEYITDGG